MQNQNKLRGQHILTFKQKFQNSFSNSHNEEWSYRHQGKYKYNKNNFLQGDSISDSKERIAVRLCTSNFLFGKSAFNGTNSRKTKKLLQGLVGPDWRFKYISNHEGSSNSQILKMTSVQFLQSVQISNMVALT